MGLKIEETEIQNLVVITPQIHCDHRGAFSEIFRQDNLKGLGFHKEFIQDNESSSTKKGTLRGLHFQAPPFAQDKLVRVIHGAILDVAVDIRTGSPTFGHHIAIELSSENRKQLLIPTGFAHGFITVQPDTIVSYKVTNYYAPEYDSGIIWNDDDLAINWPCHKSGPTLSDKDLHLGKFSDLPHNLFPFSDFSF